MVWALESRSCHCDCGREPYDRGPTPGTTRPKRIMYTTFELHAENGNAAFAPARCPQPRSSEGAILLQQRNFSIPDINASADAPDENRNRTQSFSARWARSFTNSCCRTARTQAPLRDLEAASKAALAFNISPGRNAGYHHASRTNQNYGSNRVSAPGTGRRRRASPTVPVFRASPRS